MGAAAVVLVRVKLLVPVLPAAVALVQLKLLMTGLPFLASLWLLLAPSFLLFALMAIVAVMMSWMIGHGFCVVVTIPRAPGAPQQCYPPSPAQWVNAGYGYRQR